MVQAQRTTLDDLFDGDDFFVTPKKAAKTPVQTEEKEKEAPAPAASKGGTSLSNDRLAQQATVKLQQIEKELNKYFVERENEIRSIIIGLVSGQHVLLLGPPGTGKSALTYAVASHIFGANYFQYLLNATTDPSELLGMFDLKQLEKGKFYRNHAGKLPDAHIAFLDEIYKANSAALNILLPMLNERVWYNDGQPQKANLHFAVAASNEEPQEDNLAAFHDRFPFRHWVDYVRDAQNKAIMLKNSIGGKYQPSTMISLDEIEALRKESLKVTVDDAVIRDFQSLIFELEKTGIVISDRRQATCFRLAQANAVLSGRYALLSEDFCILASVLWQKKDDIGKVEQEVLKLANPFEEKLKRFMDQVKQAYSDTMAQTKPVDKANKGVEAREAITKVKKEIDKLIRQAATAGRDVVKLQNGLNEIKKMETDIVNNCLLMVNSSDEDGDDDMPF